MGSASLPLQTKGIYHNLPTFPSSLSNLTAIVTGANGISGFHTLRVLLESPERWTKVYALSRKPPPASMLALLTASQRSRVQHVAVDFLESSPEAIASVMADAGVVQNAQESSGCYVFFYSYLQPKPPPPQDGDAKKGRHAWGNADELVKVNSTMLGNFLQALEIAALKPKRVLLQSGAKNYGVHIGRVRTPACESDPLPEHLEPNFYYPQYRLLQSYSERNSVPHNIIAPAWIIGSVTIAQINGFHPLAVYSAVQAHLKQPLQFPCDFGIWQDERFHASARLTGYLSEWAVLEDKCAGHLFNAQDTAPLSWDRLWHELARWYGAPGVTGPVEDDGDERWMTSVGKSGEETPLGYGPPKTHKAIYSFVEWAKRKEVRAVWKEMMDASGGSLTSDPFETPEESFQMADGLFMAQATLNMNKARRMGWTGYVDTIESIFEMFEENAKLGLVPPMVVDSAKPLI